MPLVRKAKLKHLGWVGDDTPLSLPKTSSGSDMYAAKVRP